jgi:hypothetical protein
MIKQEYFDKMIELLSKEKLSVKIFFITRQKEKGTYDVHKADLSDDVSETLRKTCLTISKKSYSKVEKRTFQKYDPAHKGSSCTEYLDNSELESIKPTSDLIEGKTVDLKRIDEKFLKALWYYVIILTDGSKKIVFFKKYSESMVLTKSLGLAFVFSAGGFDKLKKNIFQISDKADCILFDQKLIIRSKGNFEKIFDFLDQIKKNAEKAVKFIDEKMPFVIDDFDSVKEQWLSHEIKIRKLNNIYSTQTLEKIKPENIQPLIDKGILKHTTVQTDEQGQLHLKSDDPWELLSILDDDYVRSLLTNIDYETEKKKAVGD